jgi:hypothetical protein
MAAAAKKPKDPTAVCLRKSRRVKVPEFLTMNTAYFRNI